MNLIQKIPWRIKKLYLIIGSCLVISYDSYWFGTSGIHFYETIRNVFVLLLPMILFLTDRKIKISQKNVSILVLLILFFQIEMVFNGISFGAPALILSGVLLAIALISRYSLKEIATCFSNIIQIISIYSIIILVGISLGYISVTILNHGADEHILTAGGCLFFPETGTLLIRNSAIFREPGVFMILINMSLIFEMFLIKDKYLGLKVGILITTLLSLLSTGGFFCLGMVVITYFFKSFKGVLNLSVLIIILTLVIIPFIDEEILNFLFGKFDNIDSYGSGFARFSSLVIPLKIYLDNPIMGSGDMFPVDYVNIGYQLFHRYINPSGMSTNTIANMFAIWGSFLGLFIVYGLYMFARTVGYDRGVLTSILLMIDILLLFSNESMPYWPFLYIFIFYGISSSKRSYITLDSKYEYSL